MDKKDGFGRVYREVVRCKELTPEAKSIYAYLSCFANEDGVCWPSIELMQDELCMGRARLTKHLNQLLALGVIEKQRSRNGNLLSSNHYRITHNVVVSRLYDFRTVEARTVENRTTNNTYLKKYIISFNDICESFEGVELTTERAAQIQARLDEGYTFEDFEKLFREAEQSDFLKGRNKSRWKATFDWLIKAQNMRKALAGKYRNQERKDANAKQRNFKENTESYSIQSWD